MLLSEIEKQTRRWVVEAFTNLKVGEHMFVPRKYWPKNRSYLIREWVWIESKRWNTLGMKIMFFSSSSILGITIVRTR